MIVDGINRVSNLMIIRRNFEKKKIAKRASRKRHLRDEPGFLAMKSTDSSQALGTHSLSPVASSLVPSGLSISRRDRRSQSTCLSHGSDRGNRGRARGNSVHVDVGGDLSGGGLLLGAVARDVAGLTALVAGLAGSVEGTAVGGGAVAGDVTELAAGVALHGLSLAIAGKVVGATALVAGSRARAAGEATTREAAVAATAHGGTAAHGTGADGVGASAL